MAEPAPNPDEDRTVGRVYVAADAEDYPSTTVVALSAMRQELVEQHVAGRVLAPKQRKRKWSP